MSKLTEVLKLFCYDPETDGNLTFNVTEALTKNWEKIDQLVLLAVAAAAAYDPEGSYAVGDYCTHGGKLHKCGTAIPDGEAWTAEHWMETTVAAELAEVRASLSNKPANCTLNAGVNLDLITHSGMYRINTPTNGPSFDFGQLVVSGMLGGDTAAQIAFSHDGAQVEFRCGAALTTTPIWSDWVSLSTATPPQVRNLTLQPGFTANSICKFFVTQESIVFLAGGVAGNIPAGEDIVIGMLQADACPSELSRYSHQQIQGLRTSISTQMVRFVRMCTKPHHIFGLMCRLRQEEGCKCKM